MLDEIGGLHKFMNWKRNLLTDSGGFQMVSLLDLAEVTEEGVKFQSPHDGSEMMLTPEKSIELQNTIGADIIMVRDHVVLIIQSCSAVLNCAQQLDDVVSSLVTGNRVEEAMHRSIRWLDRWYLARDTGASWFNPLHFGSIAAHKRPHDQNLFPIIQGGLDLDLRRRCVEEMAKRDANGYAIGGLSGGEDKNKFWRVVKYCTELLPQDKPRYCMGVGYDGLGIVMKVFFFNSKKKNFFFSIQLCCRSCGVLRSGS